MVFILVYQGRAMMPVDQFMRQGRLDKYHDDFKSQKYCRIYPHPLFSIDSSPSNTYIQVDDEHCPCCKEKNVSLTSQGRKKQSIKECTHGEVKKEDIP